jgi:hypothetical protein
MIRMQSLVSLPGDTARRLHRLVEPVHLVTYFSAELTRALMALGLRNYWDGYFAGRAAPLGRIPAQVVHAVFYNFADGEVARPIPRVWDTADPAAALAAREQGSVAALRRILGDLADAPSARRGRLPLSPLCGRRCPGRPRDAGAAMARISSALTTGRCRWQERMLPTGQDRRGPAGPHGSTAGTARSSRRRSRCSTWA